MALELSKENRSPLLDRFMSGCRIYASTMTQHWNGNVNRLAAYHSPRDLVAASVDLSLLAPTHAALEYWSTVLGRHDAKTPHSVPRLHSTQEVTLFERRDKSKISQKEIGANEQEIDWATKIQLGRSAETMLNLHLKKRLSDPLTQKQIDEFKMDAAAGREARVNLSLRYLHLVEEMTEIYTQFDLHGEIKKSAQSGLDQAVLIFNPEKGRSFPSFVKRIITFYIDQALMRQQQSPFAENNNASQDDRIYVPGVGKITSDEMKRALKLLTSEEQEYWVSHYRLDDYESNSFQVRRGAKTTVYMNLRRALRDSTIQNILDLYPDETFEGLVNRLHWSKQMPLNHVAKQLGVPYKRLIHWCAQLGIKTRGNILSHDRG